MTSQMRRPSRDALRGDKTRYFSVTVASKVLDSRDGDVRVSPETPRLRIGVAQSWRHEDIVAA